MIEIWKKINTSQKYYIIFMSFNSPAGFFFTEECLRPHKWFIIPGDFTNKQYFKQQVALSMWAGYKSVARKKYFKSI